MMCDTLVYRICGVMISDLLWNTVYRGFEPQKLNWLGCKNIIFPSVLVKYKAIILLTNIDNFALSNKTVTQSTIS